MDSGRQNPQRFLKQIEGSAEYVFHSLVSSPSASIAFLQEGNVKKKMVKYAVALAYSGGQAGVA